MILFPFYGKGEGLEKMPVIKRLELARQRRRESEAAIKLRHTEHDHENVAIGPHPPQTFLDEKRDHTQT